MRTFKILAAAMIAVAALGGCMKVKHSGGGGGQQAVAPPSMNFTMRTNHRPDRIRVYSTLGGSQKAGKVRVCLRNSASGRNKGLHFKDARGPRYVVKKKNQSSCGHYSPGRKTFYLWKNTALGRMKLRAVRNVDLSGYAGQLVTFDWVQD